MSNRTAIGALTVAMFLVSGCTATSSPDPTSTPGTGATPRVTATAAEPTAMPSPSPITIELGARSGIAIDAADVSSLVATPAGFALLGNEARVGPSAPFIVAGTPDGRTWLPLRPSTTGPMFSAMAGGPLGWVATTDQWNGPSSGIDVWFSGDGVTWELEPNDAGFSASSLDGLGALAPISAGASGFAITGYRTVQGSSVSEVWISRDGRTWAEVAELEAKDVNQVMTMPAGFVALGGGCCAGIGVAAFSTDGTAWRDLTADAGSPFGRGASPALVTSVRNTIVVLEPDATGALRVVTGDLGDGAGEGGVTWQHSAIADARFTGAAASAVATTGISTLVLGFDRRTLAPISWTSPDGRSWQRTALDPTTFGGGIPGLVSANGAGAPAFAAIGFRANETGEVRPQVWRSDDGTSWTEGGGEVLGVPPPAPEAPCPSPPPTAVESFGAMAPSLWSVCFGSGELKVVGYLAGCGCGGTTAQQAAPQWLIDPLGLSAFYLVSRSDPAETGGGGFGAMINPAHPVAVPPIGTHVEVTGHFDDPASATCRVFPGSGGFGSVLPRAQTVAICERTFVATAIRRLP
jgi:hypothetical protein